MCTKLQAIDIMHKVFERSRSVYGEALTEAYLYGSYAREDFHAESDIDILLVADLTQREISSCRNALAHITSELSLEHDVTVSVTVKPFEQFYRFSEVLPYYKNVCLEGIRYAG